MLSCMRRRGATVSGPTALAILLIVAASGVLRAAATGSDTVTLSPGAGTVPLDGKWQFHLGDNRVWAAPAFDDSTWEQLTADRPWGQQGHAGYHGFAWYRRHIAIEPASGGVGAFALLLPQVGQAYEVYWNGVLIGSRGSLPPHPVWFYDPGPQVIMLPNSRQGVLALRVWNAPPLSDDEDPGLSGGFLDMPLVGTTESIAAARDVLDLDWLRSRQLMFAKDLLYGLVALLSFLVWTRYREQWVLFWVTGFTLPAPLLELILGARCPLPYGVSMALAQPIDAARDISLWFLLLWLLDLRSDTRLCRATRVLAGVVLSAESLDGLLVAISWHPRLLHLAQAGDAIITIVFMVARLFPILLVWAAMRRHKRFDRASPLVLVSALLVEMAIVVHDASMQFRRYTGWSLDGLIDGRFITASRSAISLMDVLSAFLFVSILYAVYSSFVEYRERQVQVEQEILNARELQRVLVPDAHFDLPGFQLTSAYRPAQEVGGDFFQVIPLEDSEQRAALIVVGDVSGKGLRAAMAVSFLVGAIRALARPALGPAALLQELNARVSEHLQGSCATCLILRIEPDGNCVIASAGHPGPFIDGRELEMPGALPVGIVPSAEYEETTFILSPGETCMLYTDGLPEAQNHAGEMYGFVRLATMFGRHPSAAQAANSAMYFGQTDDITVVSLKRLALADAPLDAKKQRTVLVSDEPAAIG